MPTATIGSKGYRASCAGQTSGPAAVGGYNLVELRTDSMIFRERHPGVITLPAWTSVAIQTGPHAWSDSFQDPTTASTFSFLPWGKLEGACTNQCHIHPAVFKDEVLFGNQDGLFVSLSLRTGRNHWSFKPRRYLLFTGCGPGKRSVRIGGWKHLLPAGAFRQTVVEIRSRNRWRQFSLICGDTVFIGSSDHGFYSLSQNGKMFWRFGGLDGPVVSTPVMAAGMVLFEGLGPALLCPRSEYRSVALGLEQWFAHPQFFLLLPVSPSFTKASFLWWHLTATLTAGELVSGGTLWRTREATVGSRSGFRRRAMDLPARPCRIPWWPSGLR